jgi:tight adherence protein C
MKMAIAIPILFATLGSITIALSNGPKAEFSQRIARSKDRGSVQSRLHELGDGSDEKFQEFRSKQITRSAITGLAIALTFFLIGKPLILNISVSLLISTAAYIFIDKELSKKVKKHQLAVEAEFPAIIEMYSLALSAGETPMAAMERIGICAKGSMAIEFKKVVAKVRSGKPFHVALDEMGREINSITIRRFVDSLIIATLRGAPIIEVLQRHALEARELQRNRVLGAAAKAEISMMIPVVFLILPISILFALWPSLANLNLFSTA